MKSKTKFFLVGIILLGIVLLFVYFFLNPEKPETNFNEEMEKINSKNWEQTGEFDGQEDEGISFELSLIGRCDNSEWIEIKTKDSGAQIKEISGVMTSFEDGGIFYELEGVKGSLIFTRPEFGEFLEGRKILLEVTESGEDFIVYRAKCINSDRDSDESVFEEGNIPNEVVGFEQQVMSKIAKEIDSLTNKAGNWEVLSFLWPNQEYVYVEFSVVEDDSSVFENQELADEEVESFLLLLKVGEKNQEITTEEIGLLKMNENDEWIVERGKDIFKNVEDGDLFYFDTDLMKWIREN